MKISKLQWVFFKEKCCFQWWNSNLHSTILVQQPASQSQPVHPPRQSVIWLETQWIVQPIMTPNIWGMIHHQWLHLLQRLTLRLGGWLLFVRVLLYKTDLNEAREENQELALNGREAKKKLDCYKKLTALLNFQNIGYKIGEDTLNVRLENLYNKKDNESKVKQKKRLCSPRAKAEISTNNQWDWRGKIYL